MTPHYADDQVTLHHGDALTVLRTLGDSAVDCVVTSPPYYGLRDYGEPGQYGLESLPAEYVETMRQVFAEVRRVLAVDGTLWLNLGDSYVSGASGSRTNLGNLAGRPNAATTPEGFGAKPGVAKNLLGMPWRVAFALQDDGWILRNAIVWDKPNAMPESVTDRLSTTYELVFMFTKARWTGESRLHLPDVDAAWLAALIDGEGTITIGRDRRSEADPTKNDVFQVTVSIANTSVPLLEKASRLMGGPNVHKNNEGVNRPVYAVQMSGRKAADVILAVKPWLIDKLPQADIALALQDTQRAAGVDKAAYQTAEGRAYKERLWRAALAANRREQQDMSWMRPVRPPQWVPEPYWFDLDAVREPYSDNKPWGTQANGTKSSAATAVLRGHRPDQHQTGLNRESADKEHPLGRNPGDVWMIPTQPFPAAHFAVMAPELARRCIVAGCKPGGTVLDPFCGSGTTGMVALKHGRRFVGIDLSATYLDLALRTRLNQAALIDAEVGRG